VRLPFIQLKQDAIVKARTMARLLKIPAYAGIGLAGELFVWALDMAPEDESGNVDWSGDLGKGNPAELVAAAVGWEGDQEQLLAAFIRVGFVQAADSHLRKSARVRGLDCYEATHAKALKDRDRKRVRRISTGSREDGAGQTQTQTHKRLLETPQADFGSGEPETDSKEAHWGDVAERLVAALIIDRDMSRPTRPTLRVDIDTASRWALDWCRKYEPDGLAVAQMRRAFSGYLEDDWATDRGASLSLWCAETVWLTRWDAERADDRERHRKTFKPEVIHVA
jgi:hypothetical protein